MQFFEYFRLTICSETFKQSEQVRSAPGYSVISRNWSSNTWFGVEIIVWVENAQDFYNLKMSTWVIKLEIIIIYNDMNSKMIQWRSRLNIYQDLQSGWQDGQGGLYNYVASPRVHITSIFVFFRGKSSFFNPGIRRGRAGPSLSHFWVHIIVFYYYFQFYNSS